jgi:ribosomal protein S12 methylthiotransferase
MKRPANSDNIIERINSWRTICPQLSIRSTFIVGFPGETEEDFQLLLDFLSQAKLDRVGCFKYSEVDGAKANDLRDHVADIVKEERYKRLMKHQEKISSQKLKEKIGSTLEVIIDEITNRHLIGRTKYDAPEIDGVFYIKNRNNLEITVGDIVIAKVVDNSEHDLYGELI